MQPVFSRCQPKPWGQLLSSGQHSWQADQTVEAGGQYTGPDPHGLLASALAACTGMTVWMYAQRKGWPLDDVQTQVAVYHDAEQTRVKREVRFVGSKLDDTQRSRLLAIADKCPIHKLLTGRVQIETVVSVPSP